MTVDTNYKVIPGFDWYLKVLIPQNLKAESAMTVFSALGWTIGVKTGYEAIESAEHVGGVYTIYQKLAGGSQLTSLDPVPDRAE